MPASSLAEKMKLKPGSSAALLNAPEGYLTELAPERVTFDYALDGQYDWIQVFVQSQAELVEWMPKVQAALKPVSLLWITFPKAASKIQTDLTRDQGWDSVTGLKWVNLVSVDANWSAFSLRPPKPGEEIRQRD
jgi:hypothetical protein